MKEQGEGEKRTCTRCRGAKVRCERVLQGATCGRCVRLGLECEPQTRKRGRPKTRPGGTNEDPERLSSRRTQHPELGGGRVSLRVKRRRDVSSSPSTPLSLSEDSDGNNSEDSESVSPPPPPPPPCAKRPITAAPPKRRQNHKEEEREEHDRAPAMKEDRPVDGFVPASPCPPARVVPATSAALNYPPPSPVDFTYYDAIFFPCNVKGAAAAGAAVPIPYQQHQHHQDGGGRRSVPATRHLGQGGGGVMATAAVPPPPRATTVNALAAERLRHAGRDQLKHANGRFAAGAAADGHGNGSVGGGSGGRTWPIGIEWHEDERHGARPVPALLQEVNWRGDGIGGVNAGITIGRYSNAPSRPSFPQSSAYVQTGASGLVVASRAACLPPQGHSVQPPPPTYLREKSFASELLNAGYVPPLAQHMHAYSRGDQLGVTGGNNGYSRDGGYGNATGGGYGCGGGHSGGCGPQRQLHQQQPHRHRQASPAMALVDANGAVMPADALTAWNLLDSLGHLDFAGLAASTG
ncbi:unnamed protein product [Phaeothamnion confervicola]